MCLHKPNIGLFGLLAMSADKLSDTGVAMDQLWEWGGRISTGDTQGDDNTIWYFDGEYKILVRRHAELMLNKTV